MLSWIFRVIFFPAHLGCHNDLICYMHSLNMELDLKSLFGLMCTAVLIGWDPATSLLTPHLGSYTRGRYWPAKIDDISLWLPGYMVYSYHQNILWRGHINNYLKGNLWNNLFLKKQWQYFFQAFVTLRKGQNSTASSVVQTVCRLKQHKHF